VKSAPTNRQSKILSFDGELLLQVAGALTPKIKQLDCNGAIL
jgi:hypothetical protein